MRGYRVKVDTIEVFLQRNVTRKYLARRVHAHVAEVPALALYAGHVRRALRIAQYEPVVPAVCDKPRVLRRGAKVARIAKRRHVEAQPGLVLALAGQRRVACGRFVIYLLLARAAAVAAGYYKAVHVLRLGLGKQRLRRLVYVAAQPYVAGRQPERVPLRVKVH